MISIASTLMSMILLYITVISETEAFTATVNGSATTIASAWGVSPRNRSTTLSSTVMPTPTITVQRPLMEEKVIGTRPRIVNIESAEDFLAFLEEGENDTEERLAVVKFYADWCKLCKKFGQQFSRIGREIGDLEEVTLNEEEEQASIVRKGEIRMGEIEWGKNSDLCKALGVTRLPAVHVYSSKGRLVDAFRCGPNKLPLFLEKLDTYMSMDSAELDFEADMTEGSRLTESVLDALNQEIMGASHNDDAVSASTLVASI